MTPTPPPKDVPEFVRRWFSERTPEELETIEKGGRLLWPATLKRRGAGGDVVEEPIYLRSPSMTDKTMSMILTNQRIAALAKVKDKILTRDEAMAIAGSTFYDETQTTALLSLCMLERDPPHAQAYRFELLCDSWPMASLYEIYAELDRITHREDVRLGDVGEEHFLEIAREIARVQHTGPLVAIGGYARERCVMRMATQLASLMPGPSSLSSQTSTPEH